MPRSFEVTIWHNDTDDRWVYRIKGIKAEDMAYRLNVGGTDDFGHEQEGAWNEQTSGWLPEICSCICDEVRDRFNYDTDSFKYANGKIIN